MKALTVSEFGLLLRAQQPPCISIFIPPETPGERGQTAIRWKNLVREARRLISERYAKREAQELLAPLDGLIAGGDRGYSGQGMAVFRSPDVMVEFRVPGKLPEIVVVADTFHTRPLVRYLNTNKHFFLLALAQNSVTLFEGTPEGLVALEVEGLPQELRDVVSGDAGRAYLSVHGDMGGANAPTFHGHGNGKGQEGLTKYFRAIDRALWQFLRDEHAPLLLAGVSEHHPLYRAVSRYPDLLDEGIASNVERMDLRELHQRAMKIIKNHEREVEGALFARLESALGSGRAGTDLREVASAAVHGRVRALLHGAGEHVWGKLDRKTGELEVREKQLDTEDAELIDDLSETVLLRGGDVFEVPRTALPSSSPVAAIYRY
jgi:hypothetical protein